MVKRLLIILLVVDLVFLNLVVIMESSLFGLKLQPVAPPTPIQMEKPEKMTPEPSPTVPSEEVVVEPEAEVIEIPEAPLPFEPEYVPEPTPEPSTEGLFDEETSDSPERNVYDDAEVRPETPEDFPFKADTQGPGGGSE